METIVDKPQLAGTTHLLEAIFLLCYCNQLGFHVNFANNNPVISSHNSKLYFPMLFSCPPVVQFIRILWLLKYI